MRWFAHLSNGEVVAEADEPGAESTWRRLISRCLRSGLYLTNLCLVVNGLPSWCRPNAPGYWQANLGFAALGGGTGLTNGEAALRLSAKGVGWVENDLLFTVWADASGRIWREPARSIVGERQVIWAPAQQRLHGGADERLVIQDGRPRRESDGLATERPDHWLIQPRTGLVIGESD